MRLEEYNLLEAGWRYKETRKWYKKALPSGYWILDFSKRNHPRIELYWSSEEYTGYILIGSKKEDGWVSIHANAQWQHNEFAKQVLDNL